MRPLPHSTSPLRPSSTNCLSEGSAARPLCRSGTGRRLQHFIDAAWRLVAKAITTPCRRRSSHPRSKPRCTGLQNTPKRKGAATNPAAAPSGTDLASDLLQAAERKIGRELGDEARAAPVRAKASRIDRGDIAYPAGGEIAGERVAVTLAEIGVVVTQIE